MLFCVFGGHFHTYIWLFFLNAYSTCNVLFFFAYRVTTEVKQARARLIVGWVTVLRSMPCSLNSHLLCETKCNVGDLCISVALTFSSIVCINVFFFVCVVYWWTFYPR